MERAGHTSSLSLGLRGSCCGSLGLPQPPLPPHGYPAARPVPRGLSAAPLMTREEHRVPCPAAPSVTALRDDQLGGGGPRGPVQDTWGLEHQAAPVPGASWPVTPRKDCFPVSHVHLYLSLTVGPQRTTSCRGSHFTSSESGAQRGGAKGPAWDYGLGTSRASIGILA